MSGRNRSRSRDRERRTDRRDRRDDRSYRDRSYRDRSRSNSRGRDRSRSPSHRSSRTESRREQEDRGRDRYRDHRDRREDHSPPSRRETRYSYRDDDRTEREKTVYEKRPSTQLEHQKRGGLNVEVHPLLADNFDLNSVRTEAVSYIPKASTSSVMANQRAATGMAPKVPRRKKTADAVEAFLAIKPAEPSASTNPYFDPRITVAINKHQTRPLHFQPKGKFVAQANQMRREAQMEVLKREIAESTLNSGLDVEIVGDLLSMSASQVPKVEWWDLPFLPGGVMDLSQLNYDLINHLVQRPALIQPPADPNVIFAPKPLALTPAETKKIRRQRRLQEQKEKQEKIRLGLLPPDEPKIKLNSLKTLLSNESVQDPTKVEAELKAKAAARHEAHLKANEERKLQAAEVAREKIVEVGPIINVAVFMVNRIDRNQWKYKIKVNAQQNNLTGCAIMSPKISLIVVEGPLKGLKHYKALLLRRIKWDEPLPEPEGNDMQMDLSPNECKLLWEGVVGKSSWNRFEMRDVPAEIDVKQYFVTLGLDQYWNLSRN